MKKFFVIFFFLVFSISISMVQVNPPIMFSAFTFGVTDTNTTSFLKFNLANPGSISTIGSVSGHNFIALDFSYSDLFAIETTPGNNYNLCKIDTANATVTVIGGGTIPPGNILSMTFDRTGSTMYVLIGGNPAKLNTINLNNGVLSQVVQLQTGYDIRTISINYFGTIYGINYASDNLVLINKSSGAVTVIGQTGLGTYNRINSDFDILTGKMYIMIKVNPNNLLYSIDTTNGNSYLVNTYSNNLRCLTSAYPTVSFLYIQPYTITPLILWADYPGATSFDLQIYQGISLILDAQYLPSPQYKVPQGSLSYNNTYTLRYRPRSGTIPGFWSVIFNFSIGQSGINLINSNIPSITKLFENYPNPFNPITTIKFDLSKASDVTLKIFDITGKEISTLINEKLNEGTYETQWNANEYSSGIYYYTLKSNSFKETKKMVLLK